MKYKSPYSGVDLTKMVCLATNENPYGLQKNITDILSKYLKDVNRYPKVNNEQLKELIAERYNLTKENVVITAGSDELIIYSSLNFVTVGDNTLMCTPSFFRYKQATEIAGGKCKLVDCSNFGYDLNAMKDSIDEKTKMIFICNPNNPTGTFLKAEEIDEFIGSISKDIIVVVDEAYFDFVYPKTLKSSVSLINKYKNLIVFKSFSKYFGLAGLRIGYALGDKEVISAINSLRSPYNVNSLAQIAAMEILKEPEFFDTTFYEEINSQREYLYNSFKELKLEFIPSQANFVFVRFGSKCNQICEALKNANYIIRPCAMFGYPEYVRISLGTPNENKGFIDALTNILNLGEI